MPRRNRMLATVAVAALVALTGCVNNDPFGSGSGAHDAIVIGSQDYYSNEIIAEIYAQALEDAGLKVDRQFRIGQREAYLPEIEGGTIDLIPEYTGPLLQYWTPDTEARRAEDVYAELVSTVPDGLKVLDQSPATDQDSYVVTQAFADKWGLATVADLAKVTVPLTLGGNSEAEKRPNGPLGLASVYGVQAGFTPIEDSGGPLTVRALKDGDIQLAIIYTANPVIVENNLVSLDDPKGLFLASHVVPLVNENVDEAAATIVNKISAVLTPTGLVMLQARSVKEELPAATVARDWLASQKIG